MYGPRQKVWSLMVALACSRLVPVPLISQWTFLKRPFYSIVYIHSIRVSNSEQNMLCTSEIYKLENIYHSKIVKWGFLFSIFRNTLGNSLTGSPEGCLAGFQFLSVRREPREAMLCSTPLWFLEPGHSTVAYH